MPVCKTRSLQSFFWHCLKTSACTLSLLLATRVFPAVANDFYVNNRLGDDRFDGTSAEGVNAETGPVATIQRALELARRGDTIHIAKTDSPYYESVKIFGHRNSGLTNFPFTIIGNGAVVDGSRQVPPEGWRKVGEHVWKLSPWRKGYYQLLRDGKPVPQFSAPAEMQTLPDIPETHWYGWRGAIYYRAKPDEYPPQLPFRIAYHDVGLTLYRAHDVWVRDLTFQHFRLDGVSAPDQVRDVVLENVASIENGRAGIAVGGTASMIARNCTQSANLRHGILKTGHGELEVKSTEQAAKNDQSEKVQPAKEEPSAEK